VTLNMSRFKAWLKRTPLYPILKSARDLFRHQTRIARIDQRDSRLTTRILRRLLRARDNCIDVGAHAGVFLAEFIRLSPEGRHVAIEAIPRLAAALETNFPIVEVHHAAASETPGMVEFNVVVNALALSGINRRADLAANAVVEQVSVRSVRLDDVVPPDRDVRLIKVDVEGGELGVFRGAARILGQCQPWIVFEHGSACAAYGTSTEQVFDELARHGLVVWKLDDWLSGCPPLSRTSFVEAVGSGDYWNFLAGPLEPIRSSHT